MNKGKIFEKNFKKSVPGDMFYYRLKDGTAGFKGQKNENVRFQATNICDCILFDGKLLFLLELKNHKGKSLPYSCIRKSQKEGLLLEQYKKNVVCGLVINFEDLEECYFLHICDVREFMRKSDRKSIPIDYCRKMGVKIEMKKLRVNYKYNIKKWLDNI